MYLRWLFYVNGVLAILFGLGFLFVPDAVASSYGTRADATTIVVARYWSAWLIPIGYVSWMAARMSGSPLKLHLTRAFEFIGIINVIVSVLALSSGTVNTAGGIFNLVLSAVFAVGFGYYGWAKPQAALT